MIHVTLEYDEPLPPFLFVFGSDVSIILARLTRREFKALQDARIRYSGSTGPGEKGELYGPYAPYVATSTDELRQALLALQWKTVHIYIRPGQWTVSSKRASKPR